MERRDSEYPPYPRELQLARLNPAAPRRRVVTIARIRILGR